MKFNKIYTIALALGVFASLGSCEEDRLELYPKIEDVYDGKVFNVDELQLLLNNAYGTMGSANTFGANKAVFGELMSDNAFISITNDGYYTGLNAMNFTDASSDPGSTWVSYYAAIRNANLILFADMGTDYELPEAYTIRAQAHIMKGLSYFELAQYFSPSPALGMDSPYGIVLKPNAWDPNEISVRASLKDTYEAIVAELEKGLVNAPTTTGDKYHYTKTVANFLLAKVHLHFQNNERALFYANEVINNSPAEYDFINPADYVAYFSSADNVEDQENQPETIYEVPQTANYNLQVNAHPGVFFANNGQHRSVIYRTSFKDSFDSGDIRKDLFGNAGPAVDEPRGIFIKKYQRSNSEGPFTQDVKVFRMTDVKFIKWEAMAKLGQGAAALTELNAFAATRGAAPYSGDALTAILTDKRKEFFGEGERYHDLKRNALAIVKESNCVSNCNIEATDKLFVFPIPVGEIQRNPEIQQYPGY